MFNEWLCKQAAHGYTFVLSFYIKVTYLCPILYFIFFPYSNKGGWTCSQSLTQVSVFIISVSCFVLFLCSIVYTKHTPFILTTFQPKCLKNAKNPHKESKLSRYQPRKIKGGIRSVFDHCVNAIAMATILTAMYREGVIVPSNCFSLTGGNWQKWKRVFLTFLCHKIYRDEAVGLKSCKYTWKITKFVKMGNLGQYRENLIFCP